MAELEVRVQRLAVQSQCADLVAVAKKNQDGTDDPEVADEYVDMVDVAQRPFMKRAPHTGGGMHRAHRRGGPKVARHGAMATRHRATVSGGRTLHYAVAEPALGTRFDRKEWHKASRSSLGLSRQDWREMNAARLEHGDWSFGARTKRDVVEAAEVRHVPPPGEMPCDSAIDPDELYSALPDDVLRMIYDEHATLHRAMRTRTEHDASDQHRPRPRLPFSNHEQRVGSARIKQFRRNKQRK